MAPNYATCDGLESENLIARQYNDIRNFVFDLAEAPIYDFYKAGNRYLLCRLLYILPDLKLHIETLYHIHFLNTILILQPMCALNTASPVPFCLCCYLMQKLPIFTAFCMGFPPLHQNQSVNSPPVSYPYS